jgi:hypothetical protein
VCSSLGPPAVLVNRLELLPPLVASPIAHDDVTSR